MSEMDLKQRLSADMKQAMRDKDKAKLSAIRLIMAAIKQQEVDKRIDVKDDDIIQLLTTMAKQRRDSIKQYEAGNRPDLVEQENFELNIIADYLPSPLSDDEIATIIQTAIQESSAAGPQDMGKVMGLVKPKVAGRADLGKISSQVKAMLS